MILPFRAVSHFVSNLPCTSDGIRGSQEASVEINESEQYVSRSELTEKKTLRIQFELTM